MTSKLTKPDPKPTNSILTNSQNAELIQLQCELLLEKYHAP